MKNKLNLLAVLALGIFVTMGCGMVERVQRMTSDEPAANSQPNITNGNKTVTDQAIEQIADGETTGVKECDEVVAIFAEQTKSTDDNWATKATRDYIIGQMKKSFRESLQQNEQDKTKMAEQCRDYKAQLEKQLKIEKEKQAN